MLSSVREYEALLYTLSDTYSSIRFSTLVLHMRSATAAQVMGELYFVGDIRLRVLETIDFSDGVIEDYSYEVYQGDEKLYWYDPWPHPDAPSLAGTHPHHKHVPPDIKHRRVPAPNLSFTEPNLPALIEEIEAALLSKTQEGV